MVRIAKRFNSFTKDPSSHLERYLSKLTKDINCFLLLLMNAMMNSNRKHSPNAFYGTIDLQCVHPFDENKK